MRNKKNNKRKITDDYDTNEINYYKKQKKRIKDKIMNIENELYEYSNNDNDIPLRFKVLLSNNTIQNKKIILDKLKEIQKSTDDDSKLENYIKVLSSIPFGVYHTINYDIIVTVHIVAMIS